MIVCFKFIRKIPAVLIIDKIHEIGIIFDAPKFVKRETILGIF